MTRPGASTFSSRCQVGGAAVLLCVLCCSAAAPSHLPWMPSQHGHSQYTADVTITLSTNNLLNLRRRRAVADSHDVLPLTLSFTFTVGDEEIKLSLHKNQFVNTAPPVFFIRHGKVVQDKSYKLKDDFAFYQDQMVGASVMATCPDGRNYQLIGSYFHRGQEYSIQPIMDRGRNNHDHTIYRLTGRSHLKFDAIPLLAGLYAPDMIFEVNVTNNDTDIRNYSDTHDGGIGYNMNSSVDIKASCGSINHTDPITDSVINVSTVVDLPDVQYSVDRSSHYLSQNISQNSSQYFGNSQNQNLSPNSSNSLKKSLTAGHDNDGVRSGDRRKRQAENYIVELAMVIDYGVYQVWHDGVTDLDGELKRTEALRRITQFYSFILNGIDLRYSSVRRLTDFHIDVTWAGIIIMDTAVEDYWLGVENPPSKSRGRVESSLLLETFRTWAGSLGAELPPSDHVMLFTGHNLTYGGSVSNAGLAYLGSACNLDFFFSIVEEYFDFRDVAIAAHELGHSLGARHDMDGNLCLAQDRYIMTSRFQFPSERKARNPWLFSRCSVQYFQDFIQELDRNGTNCLVVQDSTQEKEILPYVMSLPGEVYARDDFCRIGDGPSSYICRDQHGTDYNNICYGGVFCYSPTERLCLPRLPPDGFSCGNQKWCINGTCRFSDLAPATTGDDCPFGDRPDTMAGLTCAERVAEIRSECYRDTFKAECCTSCFRYKSSLPGCEYGDQFQLCVKDQCLNYDPEYARENCCFTCAELFFTMPVAMETTTAMFTWQPTGNVSTANDNSSRWRKHVASPERSPRLESEERGKIWDQTAQNDQPRLWRRWGGSESQESAESDEVMSSDFGWNLNGAPTSDIKDNPRTARGSHRMLQNLLDNLRISQHTGDRSQRMRLFAYFLERIKRNNLRHA